MKWEEMEGRAYQRQWYEREWNGMFNVMDFGATGDGTTDDSAAIQAAIDAVPPNGGVVLFPRPSDSYRCRNLRITRSGTMLTGLAGIVRLKYNGSGAEAGSVVIVEKANNMEGSTENFKNVQLLNLELDGNQLALHSLTCDGFTRRCVGRHLALTNSVNPLRVRNGFYARFEHVECGSSLIREPPAGMPEATFREHRFGAWFDVCHAMAMSNVIVFGLGGKNAVNSYTAALRIGASTAVSIESLSIENMEVNGGIHLTRLIQIEGSSAVRINSAYLEDFTVGAEVIEVSDGSSLELGNIFMNRMDAASFLRAHGRTPIDISSIDGENCDFSDRFFRLSADSHFSNLRHGSITIGVGPQRSGTFDAGFAYTPQVRGDGHPVLHARTGVSSDPVGYLGRWSTGATGHVKSGYVVALAGDNITVSAGAAEMNGQSVSFGRNSGHSQLLAPNRSVSDTWNVKISAAGTPYIERGSAPRPESAHAMTIATFQTTGGENPPTNLVAAPAVQHMRRHLGGSMILRSGAPAALFTMTLDPRIGNDDFLTAFIRFSAGSSKGASRSAYAGQVRAITFSRDQDANYVISGRGAHAVFGDDKSIDDGIGSWTIAFSSTSARTPNVLTVQAISTTGDASAATMVFDVEVIGGNRPATTCGLAAGVIPLE